jgi:ubiquitin C-terminal hydrolase
MLSFLLETLHEDVNQITKKPYVEYKDGENRSDEVVSSEYWSLFKQREHSIFVDYFYG